MKYLTWRRFSSVLLLLLCLGGPALAGDPNGWWSSSTGSRVQLWANMEQVVVTVHSPQGQASKYQGQWTRFSDYFQYSAQGALYSCAFNGADQITVTNQSTGAVTVWTRGSAPTQSRPTPPSSQGGSVWQSSSGATVQLSSTGNQVTVVIITQDGKRYNGGGRWLNYPNSFDYSIPGTPGVATCTVLSDGRIQVNYGNKPPTFWTKQY